MYAGLTCQVLGNSLQIQMAHVYLTGQFHHKYILMLMSKSVRFTIHMFCVFLVTVYRNVFYRLLPTNAYDCLLQVYNICYTSILFR